MNSFNLHLHPWPPSDSFANGSTFFSDHEIGCWQVNAVERFTMDVSFEQVESQLSKLPRMFFEMDGSFVWRGELLSSLPATTSSTSATQDATWQVDGMVYDVAGRVCRVELKGRCPVSVFEQIVAALQPANKLLAFCLERSCFVRLSDLLQAWKR
jgi:hypothetical protein